MKFTACVTTMNRPKELDACLQALWNSSIKPYAVVVSDNSVDPQIQQENSRVVSCYPGTTYLEGPHTGVSANRNNALKAVSELTELVSFFADDICVEPNFISVAVHRYTQMSLQERQFKILSGVTINQLDKTEHGALGVTFRGYFCEQNPAQVVNLYASIFPYSFLKQEQWDENIFLGQEDIELSLRALKCGYRIAFCAEMKVVDICFGSSTVPSSRTGRLLSYDIYAEASRFYIGVKRYKNLFPNPLKLLAFIWIYFVHMVIYLIRRGSLDVLPKIIQESNVQRL